jgi:hypothetical protein
MTPEEIQRTIDFILESLARSATQGEKLEAKVNSLEEITADLVRVSRQTVERTRRLEDSFQLLTRIADIQSQRLDRLEGLEP